MTSASSHTGSVMRFEALDGWRGICALMVALFHAKIDGHLSGVGLVRHAYLFVDFFFVLSGFVIAHAAGRRIDSPGEARRFTARRFARLYPLHITVLATMVVLELGKLAVVLATGASPEAMPFGDATSLHGLVSNVLLIQALGVEPDLSWNFPSWSISAEFFAYLVFAGVALSLSGCSDRVRLSVALLVSAACSLVLVLSGDTIERTYDLGLIRCLTSFFLGVAVHQLVAASACVRNPAPTVIEGAVLLLAVAFVTEAGVYVSTFLAPLVFAAAVFVYAREEGAVSRLLRARPIQALGRWSYAIYMVHVFVGMNFIDRPVLLLEKATGLALIDHAFVVTGETGLPETTSIITLGSPWLADLLTVVYLLAVLAVARLAFRRIEMPAKSWLETVLRARGVSPGSRGIHVSGATGETRALGSRTT